MRAIRADCVHKISEGDYGSLEVQNATLIKWGISPTSRGFRGGYDPNSDPNPDIIGGDVDYELVSRDLRESGEHGPYER